jgi:hypothetical protein
VAHAQGPMRLYDGRLMKIDGDDLTATLPPLDDDEHEDESGDEGAEDIDTVPDQDGDPFDDKVREDIESGEDGLDVIDGDAAAGEDDDALTDVGDLDVDFNEPDIGDPIEADVAGPEDADPDLDDDPESEDDAGQEGTTEPIEQMVDGDLPALDADDEGDFEDTLLRETGLVESAPEEEQTNRPAQAWRERADLFRPAPLGGRPPGAIDAMAFDPRAPEILIGATIDGRLLVSGDGGRTATVSDGWRTLERPRNDAGDRSPLVIALSGLRSAILVADGHLLAESADLGATWKKIAAPRVPIAAMTAIADGALAALALDASGSWLCTSVDGSSWEVRPLGLPAGCRATKGRVWLACAGEAVAIGDAAGVAVSRDGGLSFDRIAGCVFVTAGVFAGEDTAAPLVVAVSKEPGQKSELRRIDHRGTCEVVACVRTCTDPAFDDEDDGAVDPAAPIALAWDGARVWGAGPFGMIAWEVVPTGSSGRGEGH